MTRTDTGLRTAFDFELPHGYVGPDGRVHRRGRMRMATARDELAPLVDQRVRENPAYLGIVLLSLVVTRLGDLTDIHAGVVEELFAADLAYLQDLYQEINGVGPDHRAVACPSCGAHFAVREPAPGGRLGEP
ncbi:hypothetical protein [Kitasatospora sp. NPDC127116]|uniref:hypothetical protein n=1 Tax=unclassified Kitasatospora TaxID=2633591 RepID=UPI00336E5770